LKRDVIAEALNTKIAQVAFVFCNLCFESTQVSLGLTSIKPMRKTRGLTPWDNINGVFKHDQGLDTVHL